jgi:hypothetical protein
MRALVCCLMLLALCRIGAAATQFEELSPDQWPKTVSEAVARIVARMTEEDKAVVRQTPREDLIKFHRFWGMGIRNTYGLWRGNRELSISACGQFLPPR